MENIKLYHLFVYLCIALFLAEFYFFGNAAQFTLAHVAAFAFLSLRTLNIPSRKRMKFMMIFTYFVLLFLQFTFLSHLTYKSGRILDPIKFFCVAGIVFPFAVERFFIVNKYSSFYFPSMEEISTFGFTELNNSFDKIQSLIANMKKAGIAFSPDNLGAIAVDLPRHSLFRYINNGSLTEDYFRAVHDTLNDPYMYIIISDTGSAASELISVFTRKQYSHASLSFDADLKTIISYNGGDRLYPPGLNPEMIEFFHRKPDSSILVYRLEATTAQKEQILNQVREINDNGSAYNIMGLVLKTSYKSNILFCSQFVYKMLKSANLHYFTKNDTDVKPMDFIEMDLYRKLQFVYEIKF